MNFLCLSLFAVLTAHGVWGQDPCLHFTVTEDDFSWYRTLRGLQVDFNVKAKEDAVIRLYIDSPPTTGLDYYEIVIGGAGNTEASITNMGHPTTTIKQLGTFLDENAYKTFWIKKEHDFIQVGDHTSALPFIELQDPSIVPVNYFTLSGRGTNINQWELCTDGVICDPYTTIGPMESVEFGLQAVPGTLQELNDIQVVLGQPAQTVNILLSERSYPVSERSYRIEFELGSTTNIYRGPRLLSSTSTPGIVSNTQVTGLWVSAENSGVQVGLQNSPNMPFARANDTAPLNVMYYSFSGGSNEHPSIWLVNCNP